MKRLDNDSAEERHDAVIADFIKLPREGLLAALERAAGRNPKRRRAMVFLVSELTDDPEAVQRIALELRNADAQGRHWLIQTVADRGLQNLAPLLNDAILNDPNKDCRDIALWAAGKLRNEANFATVLQVANQSAIPLSWRLLATLADYGRREGVPLLEASFVHPQIEKSAKIFAAWGLAKLQHLTAIRYLGEMLYDPDITHTNGYTPGVSIRAAQALCDVKGWPFQWDKNFLEANRSRWVQELAL